MHRIISIFSFSIRFHRQARIRTGKLNKLKRQVRLKRVPKTSSRKGKSK